ALFDPDARDRQLPAADRLPRAHGAVLPLHHRRRGEPAQAVGGRRGGPGRDDERLRPLRAGETLRMRSRRASSGFTYLELVATAAILMILASAVLPMARVVRTRQKEIELRRSLRILRTAIDEYKKAVDAGKIGGTDVKVG